MPAVQSVAAHLPIDWVILGLFAALAAIDAMRSGTRHAAAFALAAPLALYLSGTLPQAALIDPYAKMLQDPKIAAAAFAGLFVLLLAAIYRMMPQGLQSGAYPLRAVLAGLAAAAALAVVWPQIPGLEAHLPFSAHAAVVFGPPHRLYWLLAAYLALAFAR